MKLNEVKVFKGQHLTQAEMDGLIDIVDGTLSSMPETGEADVEEYDFWITILKKLGATEAAQEWEEEFDMDTYRNETGRDNT